VLTAVQDASIPAPSRWAVRSRVAVPDLDPLASAAPGTKAYQAYKGRSGPPAMMTSVVCWRPAAWQRLAQASRDGPRSAPLGRFMLPGQTMIRQASHPGAVAAISFGMHGAATGGCLMTSASLPLSLAAGVTRAAPHAVNLAPVASPANKTLRTAASTQEYSAGNFINTSGRTCMARAITAPRASRLQQDWDLHQMISSWSDGILTTT
jgi:hypothetical protein